VVGKYFLNNWETNQNSLEAKFTATDVFDLMHQKKYYKGIIGSTTLYDLAQSVLQDYGFYDTDYSIDTALNSIYTTNPLKICTYKEALQQIAIAGMCVYYVDRQGIIILKQLDSTATGYTILRDNMREPTPKITLSPVVKSVDLKEPATTWFNKTFLNNGIGTSSKVAKLFACKKFPKAVFVGANTVKGPLPSSTEIKSARSKAATKIDKSGVAAAIEVILF
jgi:hypothetical protein